MVTLGLRLDKNSTTGGMAMAELLPLPHAKPKNLCFDSSLQEAAIISL